MKKIIYAFLLCLPSLFISCDDHNPNAERFGANIEAGWVEFDYDSSATITGASAELQIPIRLKAVGFNTPVNINGFDVYYEVTGMNGAAINDINFSGVANIPAGELVGNVIIDLPQSAVNTCSEYVVKLTSTNKKHVTVGFDETSLTNHTVKVGRGRDSFLGSYNVIEDGQYEYVVNVTAGVANNELVLSNLYDQGTTTKTSIFLNGSVSTGNITFPGFNKNLLFASNNPTQGDFFVSTEFSKYLTNPDGSPLDFIPSFYDPCTNSMTLNFFLLYGEAVNTPTPPINVIMTKI